MGFNFGAFAGGAADGYRKENADLRAQAQQKMLKDQVDKKQADETKRTAIFAEAANNDKARRLIADGSAASPASVQPVAPVQTASDSAAAGIQESAVPVVPVQSTSAPFAAHGIALTPQVAPLAAKGILPVAPVAQPDPASVNQSAPLASQGIRQTSVSLSVAPADPSQQLGTPTSIGNKPAAKQPAYRPATLDDSIAHSGEVMNKLMDAGLLDDAARVAPLHNAMIAEKLQAETAQREAAARNFLSALNGGDDKALLSAGQKLTNMVPDGNQLTAINRLPDGTFSVQYGNGAPQIMTGDQLTNTAAGAVDFKTALSHIQQVQANTLAAKKAKQEADNKKIDQVETERYHRAMEGIASKKAAATATGTDTAEMKNAKAFFPKLSPADGLAAFRKINSDKRLQIHPRNDGGAVISDPATGAITSIDGEGKETILRAANGSAPKPAILTYDPSTGGFK